MAAIVWLGSLQHCSSTETVWTGRRLVDAQERTLRLGGMDARRAQMRRANPEWDLMGRTFFALAIANRVLAEPYPRAEHVYELDRIASSTLAELAEHGDDHFLLGYVHDAAFRDPRAHSLFVDGEVALVLAVRERAWRLYADRLADRTARGAAITAAPVPDRDPPGEAAAARLRTELDLRVARIAAQMEAGPMASGESYPNECWTFCNTLALAALRVYDVNRGSDHGALLRRWVATARAKLIDPRTGMLVSSYTYAGRRLDGPEGSTLWMAAHNLLIVDPEFAREQYALAKRYFARSFAGFGWAREWPDGPHGADIDSGPVFPGFDIGAASSGLAIAAAGTFGDSEYLEQLARSVDFAAIRVEDGQRQLHLAAASQVAEAVIAYGYGRGRFWRTIAAPAGVGR